MCIIKTFIEELLYYLTGSKTVCGHIIRKHTKKLSELGDISFPLSIRNWTRIINQTELSTKDDSSIFDYLFPGFTLNLQLENLLKQSQTWCLKIYKYDVKNGTDVHLYLNRANAIDLCVRNVFESLNCYGFQRKCFKKKIILECDVLLVCNYSSLNLTELRMAVMQNVAFNIINRVSDSAAEDEYKIKITQKSNDKKKNELICGPVLNETGIKNTTMAAEVFNKRALDMQLMAQHKYGVQIKPLSPWLEYFQKLGKACVVIELFQTKMHKPIKITSKYLQSANKGPPFIFYNCARLSALFKEFETRITKGVYPPLPEIEKVDFGLLDQPEEWEMIYVFIMQFPEVINSSVCDIISGVVNLHNLVTFLANLSAVFSVYYRRVKVLTTSKTHLLPVLYARVYLLQVVQHLFHATLSLLDIEPIREM